MRKNAKVLSLILAGAMAMSLAGCSGSGSKDSAKETAAKSEAKEAGAESSGQETSKAAGAEEADASGETYQIGVLQLVQHDALDAANKGFFAALDEAGINYEADQQSLRRTGQLYDHCREAGKRRQRSDPCHCHSGGPGSGPA